MSFTDEVMIFTSVHGGGEGEGSLEAKHGACPLHCLHTALGLL